MSISLAILVGPLVGGPYDVMMHVDPKKGHCSLVEFKKVPCRPLVF